MFTHFVKSCFFLLLVWGKSNRTEGSEDLARISKYYKSLENRMKRPIIEKREKGDLAALAIHRGLGPDHDRTLHYRLIGDVLEENAECKPNKMCKIMDAGCGMGSAMLWFSKLGWDVQGFTLAENQYNHIKTHFPELTISLASYNIIPDGLNYSGIYAIESLWYSDWRHSLEVWSIHLEYGGRIAIIDDFAVNESVATNDPDVLGYVEGWWMKAITSVEEFCAFAKRSTELRCIRIRNLTVEYDVNKNNYRNLKPDWSIKLRLGQTGDFHRQEASIKGLLIYSFICLQKVSL